MHLRHAAEGVWILDVFFLPDNQFATLGELTHTLGSDDLSVVVTNLVHLVEERLDAAIEGFQRNGTDEVGQVTEAEGLQQDVCAIAAHELRAIEQGKTLFRLQGDGFPTELLQDFLSRYDFAFKMHLAQTE